MNRRKAILALLLCLSVFVTVAAAQRIRKHGGLLDITSAGSVTIDPGSADTVSISGTATSAGQFKVTRDPANTTNTSASLLVNPATSATNELLLGVLDNGTSRFTVDKEGDAAVAGALTVTGATAINGAITVGAGNASLTKITKYSAALTPAEVAANTCAEQTFTVTGVTASDIVFVNKPTSQAGLGVAGVRASAADTVAINFCNTTGSPITPTAAETYLFGAIR